MLDVNILAEDVFAAVGAVALKLDLMICQAGGVMANHVHSTAHDLWHCLRKKNMFTTIRAASGYLFYVPNGLRGSVFPRQQDVSFLKDYLANFTTMKAIAALEKRH